MKKKLETSIMCVAFGALGIMVALSGCGITGTAQVEKAPDAYLTELKVQTQELKMQRDQMQLFTINSTSIAWSLREISKNVERIADAIEGTDVQDN